MCMLWTLQNERMASIGTGTIFDESVIIWPRRASNNTKVM